MLENHAPALLLGLDLIELVDHDKEVRLFVARISEEIPGGLREMILRGDNEDNDIDLLLSRE